MLPPKEMKSAGRAAIVERGEGTCQSHVQHGLGAIGMFCGLGKSRKVVNELEALPPSPRRSG